MICKAAVEDMEPNHWIAWILDLPGCYSPAKTRAEAIARAPECIARYFAWISRCDSSLPAAPGPMEIEVVETFRSFPSPKDPEYLVNAFFTDDKRPLYYWDIALAQRLLDWSRAELLRILRPLDEQRLRAPVPGEVRGSIAGIVDHIAGAENWYFGMLELGLDWKRLPEDPRSRAEEVRRNTKAQLGKLIGSARVVERSDELWSARKIIRRALWHEQDHARQIERLTAGG